MSSLIVWMLVWLLVSFPVALVVGGAIRFGELGGDPEPSLGRRVERTPSPRPRRRRRIEDVALVHEPS